MNTLSDFEGSPAYFDALRTMPVGVCVVDANLRYKEINAAWADMLHYSVCELVDLSFERVTYPPDRETDANLSRRLFSGEISQFTIKKRWVRKDGSLLRGVMTASALPDAESERCGVAVIVPDHSDVIDKSHTQEVVHDLRGILHSVQLASDQLTMAPGDKSSLQTLSNAADMAGSLTRRLFFADPTPSGGCNAHRVLNNCLSIVSPTLPPDVSLGCSCTGPAEVVIDETNLGAIILNLLTNARDALSGCGRIDVICEQSGEFLSICVNDNGMGMSQEAISQATRRQYSTKAESGTGLGLYIANETLRGFGGALTIISELGAGTTIACQIPLSDGEPG